MHPAFVEIERRAVAQAGAFDELKQLEATSRVEGAITQMVQDGRLLELSAEETALLHAFRAFRTALPGLTGVFQWQTMRAESLEQKSNEDQAQA